MGEAREADQILASDGAGEVLHWTFHDLRRSAATGLARLGVNLPVVERILNHTGASFSGVAGIYQRHSFDNERRHALDLWGTHIERLVSTEVSANAMVLKATG